MKVKSKELRVERRNRRKVLRISFALTLLISFGWTLLGHDNRALADTNVPIGNVAPLPGSVDTYVDNDPGNPTPTPVSTTGWPGLEVSNGALDGNYLWLKVYVPLGTSATVTVQNGAGHCIDPGANGIFEDNYAAIPHTIYTLQDLNNQEQELGGGASYSNTLDNQLDDPLPGNACSDFSFPTITAAQGTQSIIMGHAAYRVFLFMAHIVNCPDSNPDCIDSSKVFRVYVNQGNSTAYSFSDFAIDPNTPLVGFSRTTNLSEPVNRPYGISYFIARDLYGVNSDYTYSQQFGTYCTEADPKASITFYDMDNGMFNPQFLSADLWTDVKSQAGQTFAHVPPDPHTYTADQIGTPNVNNSLNVVTFNASPLYDYKVYTNRVNQDNAIDFYVPYDQFDAQSSPAPCYASTCTYTIDGLPPPGPPSKTINNPYSIQVKMTNAGIATWDPGNYSLAENGNPTAYVWSGGPPPPSIPQNGVAIYNFTLNSSAAGTFEYDYQMRSPSAIGGNLFGDTCKISITWLDIYAYPYFKVYSGDVSAGGAFQNSDGSCDVNDPRKYIDPANNSAKVGSKYYGGIRAYAYPYYNVNGMPKGSSVDFAAFALGLINGKSTNSFPPYGFYSDAANPSTASTNNSNVFDFANQDLLGGLMAGNSSSYAHCAPDYYDITMNGAANRGAGTVYDLFQQNGQQSFTQAGAPLNIINTGTINSQLTVYVQGDVYISSNITYNPAGWGFNMNSDSGNFGSNNAPYFALIVKGNIYIDPSVNRLDGFYIAQPSKSDGSDGIIATCAPGGTEANPAQISQNCNSQIVFNGAVAAQHVHLLRSYGNASAAATSESGPYNPSSSYNAAEIFNFAPSIVLGQPDFNSQPSAIQNLNSLPPVF